MEQTVTRILGVAPYEGLQTIMERVAEDFPDVQLESFVGDLEQGVSIVRDRSDEHYDAIISRGGTAERIQKITDIPVISVQVSVYDILRAIKLAENYNKLYAIVGFPSITQPAHTLCDLLDMDADIITVHNEQETVETLDRLKLGGYKMIIGGMGTHTLARQKGFDAFLITAGMESVYDAFQQAISFSRRFHQLQRENLFLKRITRDRSGNTIVLSENGELHFYTREAPSAQEIQMMKKRIPEIPPTAPLKFYKHESGTLYRVTARTLRLGSEKIYSFQYLASQVPLRSVNNGIRAFSEVEVLQLFMNSFYSISGAMGALEKQLNAIAPTRQPVMILGEPGTGKEQIARALYLRGPNVKSPFIVIDCSLMNEKGWDFLFSNPASPLNDDSGTVYFQNFGLFPEQYRKDLLAVLSETDISKRLRLLFSCIHQQNEPVPETVRLVTARLGCLTLTLPTLRSRADEIPSLSSLYLSNLNMELGKQIIGFDPSAAELLLQYEWPNNYTQFKQVLQELATLTDSAYIRRSAVMDILSRERSAHRKPAPRLSGEFTPQTLDEITRQAIEQTIEALGGNQTAAAKQLGISRTTLWRYLSPKPDGKKG